MTAQHLAVRFGERRALRRIEYGGCYKFLMRRVNLRAVKRLIALAVGGFAAIAKVDCGFCRIFERSGIWSTLGVG